MDKREEEIRKVVSLRRCIVCLKKQKQTQSVYACWDASGLGWYACEDHSRASNVARRQPLAEFLREAYADGIVAAPRVEN